MPWPGGWPGSPLTLARSDAEPASIATAEPDRTGELADRKSRSASACAARSESPTVRASSRSSSIFSSRSPSVGLLGWRIEQLAPPSDPPGKIGDSGLSPATRSTTWNSFPGSASRRATGSAGPSGPAGAPYGSRTRPTRSRLLAGRRSALAAALRGTGRRLQPLRRRLPPLGPAVGFRLRSARRLDRAAPYSSRAGAVRPRREASPAPCARCRLVGGAPTSFQRCAAAANSRRAPAPSPSASRIFPPSTGLRGGQRLALEQLPRCAELLRRRSGHIQIPGRDLDLDLRLEERRPAQLGIRWHLLGRDVPGASQSVSIWMRPRAPRHRGPDAPSAAPAVGPTAGLVRGDERRLCARDVPSAEARCRPTLSAATPNSPTQVRAQPFAGQERFLLRFDRTTLAAGGSPRGEPGGVLDAPHGLSLPPALHRFRPLRQVQVLR